jgi:tetratricopeptide (TPR) repeat protein
MAQRQYNTWIRLPAALVTLGLVLGAPLPSLAAAAPNKTVQVLLAAAQKQVDAGNLERGAELYLEIWRLDHSVHPALYNAARLYQLAGNLDKAEQLFRELLQQPDLAADARGKAQTKLAEVQQRRAERRSEEAARAESNGQYAIAADLWAEAVAMDGTRSEWLRRWGRALHLANKPAQARSVYDRYLAQAGAAPERVQVEAWRSELPDKVEQPSLLDSAEAQLAAGNLNQGERTLRLMIADPTLSADQRARALAMLERVQRLRAESAAEAAAKAQGEEQYPQAAELWSEAIALDPSQPDWLRRWGRCLQLAGRPAQALAVYDKYLAMFVGATPERAQAEAWRKQVAAELAAVVDGSDTRKPAVSKVIVPELVERSSLPPPPEVSTAGPKVLTLASLGVAAAGGIALWLAQQDKARLDSDTWGAVKAGREIELSYADAQSRANSIAQQRNIGLGLASGGGALALIGALWWGVRASSQPAVRVTGAISDGGRQLAVQVNW